MEDFEKQEEIIYFLDKYYYIKDWFFFNRLDEQEWGFYVIETLINVYSHNKRLTEETFKSWVYSKGFSEEQYVRAYGSRKLKATWSPEMATDLAQYGIDAEQAIIDILSRELAKEIDTQIITDLRNEINNSQELLNVVECIGYTTTPTMYNPETFKPIKGFVSMGHEEIKHARQNNSMWKKWLKNK